MIVEDALSLHPQTWSEGCGAHCKCLYEMKWPISRRKSPENAVAMAGENGSLKPTLIQHAKLDESQSLAHDLEEDVSKNLKYEEFLDLVKDTCDECLRRGFLRTNMEQNGHIWRILPTQ